ncbi:hypothetical protein OIU76_007959 [Salix suchowensis]|nr:hypothetical protein OIU76_007959 [Salix suchowensis]
MHASSNGYDSSVCNRRNSHRFAHSKSVIRMRKLRMGMAHRTILSELLLMDHVLRFKFIAPVTVSEIVSIHSSFVAHLEEFEKSQVTVTLEKENANLKMEKNKLEAALQRSRNSSTDKTSPDEKVDSTTTSPRKEEVELL